MKPQIGVITLAVENLERALTFYRALGLKSRGVTATEFAGDDTHPAGAIVMFRLNGGQILALYPRSELAKDAGIPQGPAQSGAFSLGHIVATCDEVDALLAKAKAAGRSSPPYTTASGGTGDHHCLQRPPQRSGRRGRSTGAVRGRLRHA